MKKVHVTEAKNVMLQSYNAAIAMQELAKKLQSEGYELSPTGEWVKTVSRAPE